jgi:hypothetical protein
VVRHRLSPAVVSFLAVLVLSPLAAQAALNQVYQQTGNLGLELTGVAGQNMPQVTGMLTLATLPPTATVQRATLYASQNNNGTNPLTATFGGAPLGPVGPSASDATFVTLYTYQWDVTFLFIPGVSSYSFQVSETVPGQGIAGVALSVVWQDAGEPTRTVTLVEGMKQVGETGPETESFAFTALPAGPTTAWIFTVYDDAAASGEIVSYNGGPIGGPIDGNLGLNASVLQMSATSVSGNNTISIQTGADHMGWMLAATAVDHGPISVPPRSWGRVKRLFR